MRDTDNAWVSGGNKREVVEEHAAHYRAAFHFLGVPASESGEIYALQAREAKREVSPAESARWLQESKTLMRTEYGKGVEDRIEELNYWLEKHPKVKGSLEATGVMNHPKVLVPLARAVFKKFSTG